jgi:hypothetical protein
VTADPSPPGPGPGPGSASEGDFAPLPPGDPLYGVPSAAQLLHAVAEFLDTEVRPATTGRVQWLTRVSANVVATVERQLLAEEADRAAHRADLASLGATDEVDLARAVRAGELDGRTDELRRVLTATVAARLAVSNPRYLTGPGPAPS